jgi:hypothetical protein
MIRMRVVSVEALYLLWSYIVKENKVNQNKNISYILDWYQWLITNFLQSRVRTQTHSVESQKSRKSFVKNKKVRNRTLLERTKKVYSASTMTTRQSRLLRDPRRDRHKNPETFFPLQKKIYGRGTIQKVTQVDGRNVPIYDATKMRGRE